MKKIFVSLIIVFALLTACEPEKNKVKDLIFSNNGKIAKVNTSAGFKKALGDPKVDTIILSSGSYSGNYVVQDGKDIQGSGARIGSLDIQGSGAKISSPVIGSVLVNSTLGDGDVEFVDVVVNNEFIVEGGGENSVIVRGTEGKGSFLKGEVILNKEELSFKLGKIVNFETYMTVLKPLTITTWGGEEPPHVKPSVLIADNDANNGISINVKMNTVYLAPSVKKLTLLPKGEIENLIGMGYDEDTVNVEANGVGRGKVKKSNIKKDGSPVGSEIPNPEIPSAIIELLANRLLTESVVFIDPNFDPNFVVGSFKVASSINIGLEEKVDLNWSLGNKDVLDYNDDNNTFTPNSNLQKSQSVTITATADYKRSDTVNIKKTFTVFVPAPTDYQVSFTSGSSVKTFKNYAPPVLYPLVTGKGLSTQAKTNLALDTGKDYPYLIAREQAYEVMAATKTKKELAYIFWNIEQDRQVVTLYLCHFALDSKGALKEVVMGKKSFTQQESSQNPGGGFVFFHHLENMSAFKFSASDFKQYAKSNNLSSDSLIRKFLGEIENTAQSRSSTIPYSRVNLRNIRVYAPVTGNYTDYNYRPELTYLGGGTMQINFNGGSFIPTSLEEKVFVNNKPADLANEPTGNNNYFRFSLDEELKSGDFVTIDILSFNVPNVPAVGATEPLFTAFELPAELAIPEPTLNLSLTSPYSVFCSTNADSYDGEMYTTKLEFKKDGAGWGSMEEFEEEISIEPDALYQIKFSVLDQQNKVIASVIRSVKVEMDKSKIAFPQKETDQVITWHNFTLASDAIAIEHKQTVGKLFKINVPEDLAVGDNYAQTTVHIKNNGYGILPPNSASVWQYYDGDVWDLGETFDVYSDDSDLYLFIKGDLDIFTPELSFSVGFTWEEETP